VPANPGGNGPTDEQEKAFETQCLQERRTTLGADAPSEEDIRSSPEFKDCVTNKRKGIKTAPPTPPKPASGTSTTR
jgi:hypothetical protein